MNFDYKAYTQRLADEEKARQALEAATVKNRPTEEMNLSQLRK